MSPNMTSRKSSRIFSSYFWPAFMALVMAFFLSQWAVADPPVESKEKAETAVEQAEPKAAEKSEKMATDSSDVQLETTPAVSLKPMAKTALADKCYEQTDGSFECVCEGEEECKTLETADHCEAGTHWGKDGYGGCTKVANK